MVFNGLTPYNVSLCRRLANEVPELRVHSVFTLEEDPMALDLPPEINPFVVHDPSATPPKRYGHAGTKWSGVSLRTLKVARRVYQHLRAVDAKAVMLCGYASLGHMWLLRRLRRDGVVVLLRGDSNIRGDRVTGLRRWIKHRVLGHAIRQSTAVCAMGDFGRQFFERYGAKRDDIYYVPFEPDYEYFATRDDAAVDAFRREHGLREGAKQILYVGRFVPVKRIDLLIDAFAAIAKERPDWDLLLVGDGPLRESLAARLPAGLADRVTWAGFCKLPEVRAAFHVSSVLALPSDYEPWALVINEAAVADLVIVASDVVGAANELVRDRESGRIFRHGDVGSLTECLKDITSLGRLDQYRTEIAPTLAAWREKADPVDGICRALRDHGVLPKNDAGS